jgi:hypothetical protein
MTQRGYTVGTKVRIITEQFYGRTGKILYRLHCVNESWTYYVSFKIDGHLDVCPFNRSELVRVNRKRKT